ncbi:MAG TPA: sugar transferase [Anaerolineales bacterium]|nr:sugar transferase [Anaerolineales bacterium]
MFEQDKSSLKSSKWRFRPGEQRTILLFGDFLIAVLAFFLALYIWGTQPDEWLQFSLDFLQQRVPLWFYLLPIAWLVLMLDLYDVHNANNWPGTLRGILTTGIGGLLIYAIIYLVSPKGSLPRIGVGIFLINSTILTLCWRWIYIKIFNAPSVIRRVAILGAGVTGKTLAKAYDLMLQKPFKLVGFIDDDPTKQGQIIENLPVLSNSDLLLSIINKYEISEMVIAISGQMSGETFQAILDAQEIGLEITQMPATYEELLGRVPIHHLEADWIIRSFVDEARVSKFYELGKRILDIIGGFIGTMVFLFFYPFIALLILIDSGSPITYVQIRSGKSGKPYRMLKFRTMYQDAEKDGQVQLTQEKDTRITKIGMFLRRTHIDELPQFLNVLQGVMSMVGPRSERPEWISEFQKQIPFYRARLLVKPGITGWAQVNYSYYATVEEMAIKLEYDLYYLKHRNLYMDLTILLRTVGQVLRFKGR